MEKRKYEDEANYLESLGYYDIQNNYSVLEETYGKIEDAIELLMNHPHFRREKEAIRTQEGEK